jgi:hypothetical protein
MAAKQAAIRTKLSSLSDHHIRRLYDGDNVVTHGKP